MSESKISKSGLKSVYFLRQLLINSAACVFLFIHGLEVGAPTVLVPQLRQEANSTDAVTPEQASWLPAISSYTAVPGLIFQAIIATIFGRKVTHAIASIGSIIAFTIFYCSTNIQEIMISQFFQGLFTSPYAIAVIMFITECTSSDHRGLFLTLKAATFAWGVLTANLLGTFFHWTKIPLLCIIFSAYSLICGYFCPESPLWLAKMGRFEQCAKSHRWLKGSNPRSEKELDKLLADHQNAKYKVCFKNEIVSMAKGITKKEIYKPIYLSFLLLCLNIFSGKLVCTVYAVDILKLITNNTSTAYTGMLIIDIVTVLGMYIGSAFSKMFKRRILLLTTSFMGVAFLFVLSLHLYLVKLSVISENKYVSIALLLGFSVTLGSGPLILASTIAAELTPLELRSFTFCIVAIGQKIVYSCFMKLSPYSFNYLGMHGTFFFFGVLTTVCILLLYCYLPETKDKTLQEIADCIKGVTPVEETKELLPIVRNVMIVDENQRNLQRLL